MSKIPIKVKKGKLAADKIADELKVDLRNGLAKEQKQPRSTAGLFLSIFLGLVILGLSAYCFFLYSQKIAFSDLVPEEAIVFSLINQQELYPQILPFSQFLREKNFYGQEAINKLNNYFNQAQLNFQEDIQPLFKKQIAFILLPANTETALPFILLLKKNSSTAQIGQILDKIELKLKQDYNFSSQVYRQIEITVLKPLFSSANGYVYGQVDNYFIISNSQKSLEKAIDSIIDK